MPVITLKFQGKPLGEFNLESTKSLSIGRTADNDVTIDNLAVSGHHAKIDAVGNEYIYTDLKSRNGSFINDEMVSSHKFQHGDVVTIGKHTLEFTYKDDEPPPEEMSEDLYKTMVMDTGKHRAMMEKSNPETTVPPRKPPKAVLSLLAGGQGEVIITKKLFKIGKSKQNDFQVNGLWVGQTAATISQRPDGYYLSYVGGMTKPKLNGKLINTSVHLEEFDIIGIGRIQMQLVFKDSKSD